VTDINFSPEQMAALRETFIKHGTDPAKFDAAVNEGWGRDVTSQAETAQPTPEPHSYDGPPPVETRTHDEVAFDQAFGAAERPEAYKIDWREVPPEALARVSPTDFRELEMGMRSGLQVMGFPAGLGGTLMEYAVADALHYNGLSASEKATYDLEQVALFSKINPEVNKAKDNASALVKLWREKAPELVKELIDDGGMFRSARTFVHFDQQARRLLARGGPTAAALAKFGAKP